METEEKIIEEVKKAVKECCEEKGKTFSKTPLETRWNITIGDKPKEM